MHIKVKLGQINLGTNCTPNANKNKFLNLKNNKNINSFFNPFVLSPTLISYM